MSEVKKKTEESKPFWFIVPLGFRRGYAELESILSLKPFANTQVFFDEKEACDKIEEIVSKHNKEHALMKCVALVRPKEPPVEWVNLEK